MTYTQPAVLLGWAGLGGEWSSGWSYSTRLRSRALWPWFTTSRNNHTVILRRHSFVWTLRVLVWQFGRTRVVGACSWWKVHQLAAHHILYNWRFCVLRRHFLLVDFLTCLAVVGLVLVGASIWWKVHLCCSPNPLYSSFLSRHLVLIPVSSWLCPWQFGRTTQEVEQLTDGKFVG